MRIQLDPIRDLPEEGKGKVLLLADGREVAIFRKDGKLFAIDNICPHEGGPLGEGTLEGTCVTCPWHGWQFDITNGKGQNSWEEDVKSYPIEVENEAIFLIVDKH